jgi:hypothetical protein
LKNVGIFTQPSSVIETLIDIHKKKYDGTSTIVLYKGIRCVGSCSQARGMLDLISNRHFESFKISYQELGDIMTHFVVGLSNIVCWWTTLGWFSFLVSCFLYLLCVMCG